MHIKVKDFNLINNCQRAWEFQKMGVWQTKPSTYKYLAIKKSLKENDYSKDFFMNYFNSEVPPSTFTPLEIETMSSQFNIGMKHFTNQFPSFKLLDLEEDVVIQNTPVTVYVDGIVETDDTVKVVQIKTSSNIKEGNSKNSIKNNLEAFCLYHWGVKNFPNKTVEVNIFDIKKLETYAFDSSYESNQHIRNLFDLQVKAIENAESQDGIISTNSSSCFGCKHINICALSGKNITLQKNSNNLPQSARSLSLTKEQHKAIMFNEGVMRINAGAGSGKTLVIALRTLELLKKGNLPEEILLMTFTNKATQEMLQRVEKWVNEEGLNVDVSKIKIQTFNSFCYDIVKANFKELGYTNEPKVSNGIDRLKIIEEILIPFAQRNDLFLHYQNPFLNTRSAKGALVLSQEILDEIESTSIDFYLKKPDLMNTIKKGVHVESRELITEADIVSFVKELYEKYTQEMKKRGIISFNGQIQLALKSLDINNPYKFKHIIVDEFQDTSVIQIDLILKLIESDNFKSLMVVGDDAQAIYGFRYASKDNLIDFNLFFDEVKDLKLETNFRSTNQIVSFANKLNDLNIKKINKKLKSNGIEGTPPTIVFDEDIEVISSKIVDTIKELKDKYQYKDIAIISRSKKEIIDIQKALSLNDIPSIIDVPESLIKNPDFLFSLSLLDDLINQNNTSWAYYYLIKTNDKFISLDRANKKNLLNETRENVLLRAKELEELDNEKDEQDETGMLKDQFYMDILREVCEEVICKKIEEIYVSNGENIQQTLRELKDMLLYQDQTTFLRDVDNYDAITLTTAHTSKGKEYDVVIVLLDGFIYLEDKSFETKGINDEERRVLYVSITRAKKELFMFGTLPPHNQLRKELTSLM